MEFLASLFVGKPQNILAVGGVFFVIYLVLRFTKLGIGFHPRSLLIPSVAWTIYAAWEWLVYIRTPEANIRVDLMVIWPVLAIVSASALFRTFR